MVLILPKGNGEFRRIGFVKVLWKALLGVFNRNIRAAVNFDDTLHGL